MSEATGGPVNWNPLGVVKQINKPSTYADDGNENYEVYDDAFSAYLI